MPRITAQLPPGLTCYRRTAEFTRVSVPAALLRAHNTKAGVWGLLRVLHGRVLYCLDGSSPQSMVISQAGTAVIELEAPHHVELLDEDSVFQVEFYRTGGAA